MSTKTVLIETDALGAFEYERPLFAEVVAIVTVMDELAGADVTVSDVDSGDTIRQLNNLAADDFWTAPNPAVVYGTLRVEVANGGDTKHGRIRFLLRT